MGKSRNINCFSRGLAIVLVAWAGGASAEIVGKLEAPFDDASEISNVQGWVYTTNPGAELIQPFDVEINGVKVQEVPCCSDRGDVRDQQPGAPLSSGFSGVINWAREALDAAGPVVVSVIIRDTSGDEIVLETPVLLHALASFPYMHEVLFSPPDTFVDAPAGGPPPVFPDSRCRLANVPAPGGGQVAKISCTGLVAVNHGLRQFDTCAGEVRFQWDKASQGFKQKSSCIPLPRWTNHGDGTATDNTTGLMWELKTGELGDPVECTGAINDPVSCSDPHHLSNIYAWNVPPSTLPDGPASTLFLAQLNQDHVNGSAPEGGCFADYCDWRVPTIDELKDMQDPDCEGWPCTSIPGAKSGALYHSSTRSERGFLSLGALTLSSSNPAFLALRYVRAVRRPTQRNPIK